MEFDTEAWKELGFSLRFCSREVPPPSRNYTCAKYADYYSVIKQTCFLECHSANIISQRGILFLCKISFVLFARALAKICVFHAGEKVRGREKERKRALFYNQTQRFLSGKTLIISVVIKYIFPTRNVLFIQIFRAIVKHVYILYNRRKL